MDSEHRHELKTNELANVLTHFPQFLKENANTIIGIALILIALITWPMFTKMSRQKTIAEESAVANSIQMLGQDIGAALRAYQNEPEQLNPALNTILANADKLMETSSETDNPNLSALAYIKAAQAIRTELHLRNNIVDTETIDTQTQKAQDAYDKAAQMAVIPTIKAMAQFGTGLCTEERGQTQQAADIYTAIVNDETFAGTVFPKLAQQRLDSLDDNAESFTFAEPAAPVEEPDAVQAVETVLEQAPAEGAEPGEMETPPAEEPDTAETDSQE